MSLDHRSDRRQFIQRTCGGVAALATAAVPGMVHAADRTHDKIGLGFIGLGGRGNALLAGFMGRDDCRVVGLCDVHQQRLEAAVNKVSQQTSDKPAAHADIHQLLADPAIDAVVIATTDHWHAPATIYACQAGKHVYVEKPISNNVWEGRKAVEAARKYDRVVQAGTQNRSAPYNFKARDYIQSGKLGDIVLCRVYNQKSHGIFSMAADATPPDHLDWDRWNGPCPRTQFNPTRYGHWHDFWDYGGGDVTNDGVHQLDLACMVLGIETLPKSVYTIGQRRADTAAETPDTVITTFDFGSVPMTFHQTLETPYMFKTDGGVRSSDMFPLWQQNATRIEIFGTQGVMFLGRHGGGWQVFGRPKSRQPVVAAQEYGRFPDPEHKEDFVQAIRRGRLPNADVEHGHRCATLSHLANISFRVGNQQLEFDPLTEQFTDSPEANQLLHPEYRQPYMISEKV